MRAVIFAVAIGCVVLAATASFAAERPKEPLVEQVRKAIDDGKKFLRSAQHKDDGGWDDAAENSGNDGGWTSLALLALLNSGEKPDSPVIQDGLKYLRKVEPRRTYVVGLQTMVFAEAGFAEDKLRIDRNVKWLIDSRVMNGDETRGWDYTPGGRSPDNSVSQYALLGLHAAKTAGAKIDPKIWESIQKFYLNSQARSGGWPYGRGSGDVRYTMTVAGLCGLIITGMELNQGKQKLRADGSAENCGIYVDNEPVARAMDLIGKRFNKLEDKAPYVFYNLYGLERAGRLSGHRFFGDNDWYRAGCEYLVKTQRPDDGSWYTRGQIYDRWPTVSTSFALLFLSKGRTPILISKLVHGSPDNLGTDWNNKHSDCRNLVDYASKELFKKQPLGWQIFNARQSQDSAEELTGELLSSPIVYINGHNAPILTGREETMLRKYIEEGGFLFAEACCGSQRFDAEFRALMKKLFPDKEHALKPLRPDHPIWTAHAKIALPKEFPLEGIEFGCKTVVVYCPKAISGYWEANQATEGHGQVAFRLAGNIIAYATGMELPKPRGTKVDVAKDPTESKIPRGYLKVAQLKHTNDRHSTNGVLRNLMVYLRTSARIDVAMQTQELQPGEKDLLNYKFMFMHGRGDFDIDELDLLRANLKTGGLLLADACCGKKAFDTSFRKFVSKLFPENKLEPIPADDPLFSKELNGTAITTVRCRREGGDAGYKDVAPALEGIKIDGRWVVIYSKYDLGCAIEKHQSTDCLGYDHASALRLAGAIVLYALHR
ncbi:MAG: DUF4159 domain-containing protein [Gemmataceae bacterium]|nr:DUF4159 domain-containing protein [Gemmataceae bacterium]